MTRSSTRVSLIERPIDQPVEKHRCRAAKHHADEHQHQNSQRRPSVRRHHQCTKSKWQGENRVRKANQSEKSRHGSTTCDRLSLSIFSLHKRDDSETETLSHTLIVSIRVHSWLIGRRSHSAPSPFRIYREMFVLKMLRNAFCLFHFDRFGRGVQRVVGFPAFGRTTHV